MVTKQSGISVSICVFMLLYNIAPAANKKIIVPDQYPSIQKALNAANEKDTVFVRNGTYKENITLPDNIVLTGESPDKTILKGNRHDALVRVSNYSLVSNFTIKQGGIGVLSENTNATIVNNIIKENSRTGIQCLVSLPLIQNNLICDNEWSGVYCELVAYGTKTSIEHNVFADNGNSGIVLSRKSGVLVQNNVFYNNKQYGICVSKDSRKSRIIYNNFFEKRNSFNEYAVIDESNVSVDPQFPKLSETTFETLVTYKSPVQNMGKNGETIGLISKAGLKNIFKDSDEDGIADQDDQCPDLPEDMDGFQDTDGCPDNDNDADGMYDTRDACPDEPEDFDGFQDGDGCPDLDNDKDGIPDSLDKCPNEPEDNNGFQDEDGCPDKGEQEKIKK
jgi:parallel beta-helix repeat protein